MPGPVNSGSIGFDIVMLLFIAPYIVLCLALDVLERHEVYRRNLVPRLCWREISAEFGLVQFLQVPQRCARSSRPQGWTMPSVDCLPRLVLSLLEHPFEQSNPPIWRSWRHKCSFD